MYPEPELQKSIVAALNASAALAAAMGGAVRAYDSVPPSPQFPYLHISESQIIDDGNACGDDLFEVFATIHIWSRATGFVETKKITAEVREVLKALFAVSGFTMRVAKFENAFCFTDADGVTTHGIAVFKYLITA